MLAALTPEGQLETALAERVALLLWRLQRAVRFERDAAVMTLGQEERSYFLKRARTLGDPGSLEEAYETLEGDRKSLKLLERFSRLPDGATLSAEDANDILEATFDAAKLGQDSVDLPDGPDSEAWTAGSVREAVNVIASHVEKNRDDLLAAALGEARAQLIIDRTEIRLGTEHVERMRRWYLLPDGEVMNKIIRYESHLNRQLYQALHELEALQARRRGLLAPLARLEVHGLPEG